MPKLRVKIEPGTVERLASINCSNAEIAAVIGCHVRTIERRYLDYVHRGREVGKSSLKRKMWDIAMSGNVPMLIWLSKVMLGYREESIVINSNVKRNNVADFGTTYREINPIQPASDPVDGSPNASQVPSPSVGPTSGQEHVGKQRTSETHVGE